MDGSSYNLAMAATPKNWTTRGLLQWTTDRFRREGFEHPRLAAEMLLAHVLEADRLKLYLDPDRPTSDLERAAFRDLVERALKHEPVDYLVGQAPFFAMMFKVTSAVLVPRPSTETIVEHVIQHARRTPGFARPLIADIGTGSGAIAVALAKHLDGCRIIATDISAAALEVARGNALTHGVADRIDFREGDLLEPLDTHHVRYLISNPPYISDAEWQDVPPNVKHHEPLTALRGGPDGLDYLRPIIEKASRYLDTPGQLVLEGTASHMDAVKQLAIDAGFDNVHVLADHEALPRVLVADAGS
jgi:release factor glutamine methyltransferase